MRHPNEPWPPEYYPGNPYQSLDMYPQRHRGRKPSRRYPYQPGAYSRFSWVTVLLVIMAWGCDYALRHTGVSPSGVFGIVGALFSLL